MLSHSWCYAQVPPQAQAISPDKAVSLHPWVAPTPNTTSEVYFSNLLDNAEIETPFRVTFGLTGGWGLAPIASSVKGKSGHHHLLVNRDLPLDFSKALPFNDQYIHFGKGQMETVLSLEPGIYTLRLLLADDMHVPRFVFSKPLKVTVTRKKKDVDPKSLVTKGVSLLNIAQDAKLKPPFRVQFHASGLNVAHVSQKEKETGHFQLTMTPSKGGKPEKIVFVNGQTEVWLAPPVGTYKMQLDFVDNSESGKNIATSAPVSISVE
jgi:hypothetical protein